MLCFQLTRGLGSSYQLLTGCDLQEFHCWWPGANRKKSLCVDFLLHVGMSNYVLDAFISLAWGFCLALLTSSAQNMPKVSKGDTKTALVGLFRSLLSEKSAIITLEGLRSRRHVKVKLQNYQVQGHERLQKQNLRSFWLILVERCLKYSEWRWSFLFVGVFFAFFFFALIFLKWKFFSLFKNNLKDAFKTGGLLKRKIELVNVYKSHTILFNFGKVIKGYIWVTNLTFL